MSWYSGSFVKQAMNRESFEKQILLKQLEVDSVYLLYYYLLEMSVFIKLVMHLYFVNGELRKVILMTRVTYNKTFLIGRNINASDYVYFARKGNEEYL